MLSGVQTGNGTPHDEYDIRGIAHARTNRKDEIFMQRRLVQNSTFILKWGQGTRSFEVGSRDLFIDEAHTALDIGHTLCMLPSPLCNIFYKRDALLQNFLAQKEILCQKPHDTGRNFLSQKENSSDLKKYPVT